MATMNQIRKANPAVAQTLDEIYAEIEAEIEAERSSAKTPYCADCGQKGVLTGHMECQYPQDHE